MTRYDIARMYGYNSVEEYDEAEKRKHEIFTESLKRQETYVEKEPVKIQPVNHGRWIDCTFYDPYEKSYEQNFEYKCSCCGHMIYNKPNDDNQYCGHCGARMIKEGDK